MKILLPLSPCPSRLCARPLFLAPSPTSPSLSPLSLSFIQACRRPPAICLLEEASSDNSYADNIPAPTTKVSSFHCIALPCVANRVSPSLPNPSIDVSSPPSPALPLSSLPSPTTIARPALFTASLPLSSLPSIDVSSPLSPALPLSSLLFASHHSPSPALLIACHLPFGGSFSSKLAVVRPSLPPVFPAALLYAVTDRLFLSSSRQPAAIRTSSKHLPRLLLLSSKNLPSSSRPPTGLLPIFSQRRQLTAPSHVKMFLLFYRFDVFF